ncbi:TatD family hydrolase [Gulosibacter hominis]|uniref:TatD family hydrolase n=1 Tax=Gulosibacter hominis TaxID=2770504 RepID=UPI00191A230F|nr:TatD family hydrolase [Gulosibacter hominis]
MATPTRRSSIAETGHHRELKYPEVPEPLGTPCYDNHTHLQIEDGEVGLSVAEHMDLAAEANILGAITVAGDVPSSRWQVAAAQAEPRLLAAVAIHPNEAPGYAAGTMPDGYNLDEALTQIDALAADERVAAIGETGLDFFRTTDADGIAAQYESFAAHIELAKRHRLPMQIHDRDAHDEVVATLKTEGAPAGTVFHCFSGDAELAKLAADEGWYLSFAGTVTFKNAPQLREALEVTPLERILVETDAPFLTPMPFRGRPNAPYLIPITLRFMAAHLGMDADELAAQVAKNTLDLYGPFDPEARKQWLAASARGTR